MNSYCIYNFKAEGKHPMSEKTYRKPVKLKFRSRDVSIAMSYAFLKCEKAFCSRS